MKVDIVVVYVPRYRRAHEFDFVPPITGIHLAALTPSRHPVRVIHQQVEAVDLDTDADLVALSFFTGFAHEAYRLADALRARGRKVVAGGPHVTHRPEEALAHFDAVLTGEAESAWAELLADAEAGRLRPVYAGSPEPLEGLPVPRYDLLPGRFFLRRVVQATRGCPFHCSFCSVPTLQPGFRVRPVEDVMAELRYERFPWWWQRKVAWFWDDNLTANRAWAKDLMRQMIGSGLKRWWLTQASVDIARDPELLELMRASGCIGVFFGIETFETGSLQHARKEHNRLEEVRRAVEMMHRHGICVMSGLILGFDGDTPETIARMADHMEALGVDVPFMSVLTPFPGTPLYDQLQREGRLIENSANDASNGYNVSFVPRHMTPDELLASHRALWHRAFSPLVVLRRVARAWRTLRPGAALMSTWMNAFYGLKRLRGNAPRDAVRP